MSSYHAAYLIYQQQVYSTLTFLAGLALLLVVIYYAASHLWHSATWLPRFQMCYLAWCAAMYIVMTGLLIVGES